MSESKIRFHLKHAVGVLTFSQIFYDAVFFNMVWTDMSMFCRLIYCIAFSVVFGMSAASAASEVSLAKRPAQEVVKDDSLLLVSQLKAQVEVLKLQNTMIRDYQDRMSNTVYWALGVVAGIFTLLMGYSVFTNFRLYEQDKIKLKEDLQALNDVFRSDLVVRFEQDRGALERTFDLRHESNVKIVLEQGAESRAKIESVRAELVSDISEVKLNAASVEEKLAGVKKRSLIQAAQFYGVEEMVWSLKDNPSCIIITQSQALDAAVNADSEYFISATLKRLSTTLDKHYIGGEDVLRIADVKTVEEMLTQVNHRESQLVHEIREKLQRCRKNITAEV